MMAQIKTPKSSKNKKQKEHMSTVLSFVVFSTLIHIIFSVLFSCTQDILAGTNTPTATVLSASMVPNLIVELVGPYFLMKIPKIIPIAVIFVNTFVGFITVAYVNQVKWKIVGVAVVTFGLAIGSIRVVSLTSYFTSAAISAYSTGSGVGLLLGSLYYTAMTTWFCVSPNVTIVILSPFSVLFLLSYYVINKNKGVKNPDSTTHKEVAYTKIQDKDTEEEKDLNEDSKGKETNTTEYEPLTRKEKMAVIAKLFSLTAVPTFTAFCSQYLLTLSVITTVAYKNAPFGPRDHYQYYSFTFMSGELIGRCHRLFFSLLNLGFIYVPSFQLLWCFSFIIIFSLFLMIFESWYHFFPSVGVVLFICFSTGFVTGSFYDNMLVLLHITFEGKKREFVLGYNLFPISAGMLTAACMGFYTEPLLREHCITMTPDSAYCFTRPASLKDIAFGCRHS